MSEHGLVTTRQIVESIAAWGHPKKCHEWVWPGTNWQMAESIDMAESITTWGTQICDLVRQVRLQNPLSLGGI